MCEPDLGHQLLKAFAIAARGAGQPQVGVDDDNALLRPAQGHGTLTQSILALGAFPVFEDLPYRRLPHIQVGIAPQVIGGDFRVRLADHTRTAW